MQPAGITSLVDALVCIAYGYSLHGITVTSGLYLAFALTLQRYNYKPLPGVSLNCIMVCYTLRLTESHVEKYICQTEYDST